MIKRAFIFDDIKLYLERLVDIFIECFSVEPWRMYIEREDAIEMFKKDISYPKQIFLLKFDREKLVGAAIACPVRFQNDIAKYIDGHIWARTICLSRIFVAPGYQAKKIGQELHLERLRLAKEEGFDFAVQRTNPDSKMYPIILKTGFKKINEMRVYHWRNTSRGRMYLPDLRVISVKEL